METDEWLCCAVLCCVVLCCAGALRWMGEWMGEWVGGLVCK